MHQHLLTCIIPSGYGGPAPKHAVQTFFGGSGLRFHRVWVRMPAGYFRPSPNFLIQTFGSVILYDSLCGFAAFLLVSVTLLRFCSDPYPFATDAGVAGGMGCYSDWGSSEKSGPAGFHGRGIHGSNTPKPWIFGSMVIYGDRIPLCFFRG